MTVTVHGVAADGFDGVRSAFASAFEGDPAMGASLAIRVDGRPVVDLWGGDASDGAPWSEDTLSVIFSCTKGLVSLVAARLVQDGLLDYDAPVGRYWPEFAVAGKERTLVSDLLAHRSGVSAPREPLTTGDILEWETVIARLAAQEPLWQPGTGHAYHAITHGWLIGEVIRRITGQSVGECFRRLIAGPLGAEAWIGLPANEQHRVATMRVGPSLADLTAAQARARTPGATDWAEQAMTLGGALPHELVGSGTGFNDPAVREAEIPGAGGVASARALAAIWSAAVVETDGVRLLRDETIAAATVPQSSGAPVWDVPGPWPAWGMGFQLGTEVRRYLTPSGFGHDGAGGQVAFADAEAGVGFAFLTNRMDGLGDTRGTAIIDALAEALGLE